MVVLCCKLDTSVRCFHASQDWQYILSLEVRLENLHEEVYIHES